MKRVLRSLQAIPVAALVAATVFAVPAHAQRLSLAERVAKLEQEQGQGGAQANIQLVNQINALQSQLQNLQGQIEELRHQVDELKSHGKDQYIDLDSRIGRLEGRNPAAAPAPAKEKQVLTVGMFQKALYEKGFYGGHWDGHYGPLTRSAVCHFQAANGIAVDGEPSAETLAALGF